MCVSVRLKLSCVCPHSRFNILVTWKGLKGKRGWSKRGREREKVREMREIRDWLLIAVELSGGIAYFPFVCVFSPPPHNSLAHRLRGGLVEKESRTKDSCHFSFIYPLSFSVSSFVKISFSCLGLEILNLERSLDNRKQLKAGKEDERRMDGRKEKKTHIYAT